MTVKGDNRCKNWPEFPISVYGATGGLIGNTVMICGGDPYGGYGYVDECYSLTSEKATLAINMTVGRWLAVSIGSDNSLWVTGGFGNTGLLASTEYVTMSGTIPGPDLPMVLARHAIVAINSTCSMVIGGMGYDYYASTFFYDHIEGEWTNGPSLMEVRFDHAAGLVTDEVTDEHYVAVTGGTSGGGASVSDSTEMLQDGEWVQGKILIPYAIF